jgi:hypothetical protein
MAPGGTGADPEPLCWDELQGSLVYDLPLLDSSQAGKEWWRRSVFPIVGTTQSEFMMDATSISSSGGSRQVVSSARRSEGFMTCFVASRCATRGFTRLSRHGATWEKVPAR